MLSKVSLLNWAAYLPNRPSFVQENAVLWAALQDAGTLNSSLIEPMLRRRCSPATRIALSVAAQTVQGYPIDYAVFCSQHGEVSNTLLLLDEVRQAQTLSPTRFAQSVHNTASGLFCISQNLPVPATSIAARDQSFAAGMIEALSWLEQNPNSNVLVLMFDEALPEIYADFASYNKAYGLGLVLSNKEKYSPSLQARLSPAEGKQENSLPQALQFLIWYLQGAQAQLQQDLNGLHINWSYGHD